MIRIWEVLFTKVPVALIVGCLVVYTLDDVLTKQRQHGQYLAKYFKISWYNPPTFLVYRPDAMFSGFEGCTYSNCKISYISTDAKNSDAVIFTGRLIPTFLPFIRPNGQIWIFSEQEPPYRYSEHSHNWNQTNVFNWTMTYDSSVADIHLPYGEIKASKQYSIDSQSIMQRKNKTALIVMSHCETPSERMRYINELQRYIDVDVYGDCGIKWHCGQKFKHDACFEIVRNYKFYLAFENSFCNNYFTEKVFANFDSDTVLVVRGGLKGQSKLMLPEGTFVPADEFENAKQLGTHLKLMSVKTYINILKRKSQYTSLNSYISVFHRAMCAICKRMNNLDKFKQSITDMSNRVFSSTPCIQPYDLV